MLPHQLPPAVLRRLLRSPRNEAAALYTEAAIPGVSFCGESDSKGGGKREKEVRK